MKIKIQVGVEVYKSGKRTVRLTPVDRVFPAHDELVNIVLMLGGIADAADQQPGDGEVDLPIGTVDKIVNSQALSWIQGAVKGYDGDANVFLKISKVP